MKHYYFKFQTGNEGVRKWINNGGRTRKEPIPLSIYFGNWKANQKEDVIKNPEYILRDGKILKSRQRELIKKFYSIENNPTETLFWIFYDDEVLCFKPKNGRVEDGNYEQWKNEHDDPPKTIYAEEVFPRLKKKDLPEVFANIDSYQKYNRVTIAELKDSEKDIADYLINKDKVIPISHENYFKFLSPIEFETLIFLIFNNEDSLCSSFRGGTLKGFDLKVKLSNFNRLPNSIDCGGIQWIQAKKDSKLKSKERKRQEQQKDRIIIYLGVSDDSNRILGVKWLTEIIDQRPDIKKWLKNMTLKYYMFKFSW